MLNRQHIFGLVFGCVEDHLNVRCNVGEWRNVEAVRRFQGILGVQSWLGGLAPGEPQPDSSR